MSPSKAPVREPGFVTGPAGQIETLLESPADGECRGLAIICHPHPLHGGAMTNKVTHTLARVACDLGLAAMRFNFRGVGASEGEHDDGVGEIDDAAAVLTSSSSRFPGVRLFAGFSFGGAVAIELARREQPDCLITIAPAVTKIRRDRDWQAPACPWLIVQGDADELVAIDDTVAFVDGLPPGPELTVLPGVGHFFHGQLVDLRERLVDRLQESL